MKIKGRGGISDTYEAWGSDSEDADPVEARKARYRSLRVWART